MPFPFAETVSLSDAQRAQLEGLVRARSTPQALVFRCRSILRAAAEDKPSNLQIAAEFHCDRHTVATWRQRYLARGLPGVRLSERILVVAGEDAVDFRHFRLVGTRDYGLPPDQCVEVASDGVTLTIDLSRSDLLLETELQRFAVPRRR